MKGPDARYLRRWDEPHGRPEARRCRAAADLGWLGGREGWEGLRGVASIESGRFIGEAPGVETRYYLGGPPNGARPPDGAIRGHWVVENSPHRVADVTSHEGGSRIKGEDVPEDFGPLRRPASCPLKEKTTSKRSIKGKRLGTACDDDYLLRVSCGNTGN